MKRVLMLMVVIGFLLCPFSAFASELVVYEDFFALMPEDVQSQLSQGCQWQVVEASETSDAYVLLLSGKIKDREYKEDAREAYYLLLQMPKENWQETKSYLWTLPDCQDSYVKGMRMHIVEDAVWLQLWAKHGGYLICWIDENGNLIEKCVSNTPVMLSEHGAVVYMEELDAILFWDGETELLYPTFCDTKTVRYVMELNRNIYYLDVAGDLYQVMDEETGLVASMQEIYDTLNENSTEKRGKEDLNYIDCLNCFYAEHALWFNGNDVELSGEKYLLRYDGATITSYPKNGMGRLQSCWVPEKGTVCFTAVDYYPAVPHLFHDTPGTILYCVKDAEGVSEMKSEVYSGGKTYTAWNGAIWSYQIVDQNLLFFKENEIGEKVAYGILTDVDEIQISVDGVRYLFTNMQAKPYIKNGRVMLPIRAVAELTNADISWNDGIVTITKDDKVIQIDTKNALVQENNVWQTFNGEIENVSGRIMLPIRFIAEALSMDVHWDETMQTVEVKL